MNKMWISELWRYPVKSMAGEMLVHAEIGPLGIPGDRELVVVDRTGRIQDARSRHRLLRHRATLGPGGRVQVDGRDWEDPEVVSWIRDAAGPSARLRRMDGPERFDIMPLLVLTDGAVEARPADEFVIPPDGPALLFERTRNQLSLGAVRLRVADEYVTQSFSSL